MFLNGGINRGSSPLPVIKNKKSEMGIRMKRRMRILLLLVTGICLLAFAGCGTQETGKTKGTGTQVTEGSGNVLMTEEEVASAGVGTVLGSEIYRDSVVSITFLSSQTDAPDDAWDVSEAGDGSVVAWTVSEGDKYALYIAGEGGVDLAEDSVQTFAEYTSVTDIEFNDSLYTGNVTDMSFMFYECTSLESLDLGCFDTANVTDMSYMFANCYKLQSLYIDSFDTSNVTDMGWMFAYCNALESLDVTGFDTSNVTNMAWMFAQCSTLTELNLDNFDTSNVYGEAGSIYVSDGMVAMFYGCSSLKTLDLGSFDTLGVESLANMFCECNSLESLNVSSFDTANVQSMSYMFENCSSLTELDVTGFDTGGVVEMQHMFSV